MRFNIDDYENNGIAYAYAMHCDTKEKAKIFLEYLDAVGRRWNSGQSYIAVNRFDRYESNTCYYFNDGVFGDITTLEPECILLRFDEFDWGEETSREAYISFEEFFAGNMQ